MYYNDKEINNIKSLKYKCPICGHVNKCLEWEQLVSVENDNNELISANVASAFYHCKRCGYFIRTGDSDHPDFYESEYKCGISLIKNPLMSVRQIFALKKHASELALLHFAYHKDFDPKF